MNTPEPHKFMEIDEELVNERNIIIGKAIEAAKEKQGEYDEKFYKIVTEG